MFLLRFYGAFSFAPNALRTVTEILSRKARERMRNGNQFCKRIHDIRMRDGRKENGILPLCFVEVLDNPNDAYYRIVDSVNTDLMKNEC